MNGIVSDERKKRRLPMWMLGVSAADQAAKSEKGEVNGAVIIEKEVNEPQRKSSKSRARRPAPREKEVSVACKDALEEEQSSLVVKRETVKRKRKGGQKEGISNSNNIQETGVEKRKRGGGGRTVRRTVQKSASGRRGKVKSLGTENIEDIEVASSNEDDGDLTMEDLMSIAKEFVEDDKDMGQQQPSDGGRIAESKYAAISFCGNEPQSSLDAPETSRRSPTHNETASCLDPAGSLTSDKTVANPSRTGDPTQDMLDLFLGPLLKKPLEEEKKVEVITDDMVFAHTLRRQNQEIALGNVPVPLTKKKTSLKDKVAMFLD